ncbi:triose-phosphate isomerase [Halorhodospira abdelmalekii]|uniref:triose-phosphate isomerase n=1 Tax=Halorhodospira abdelmalekii TaxID=421629 RepID=UPI001906B99E|nr:triose-phosphate isomerase [Halorhodospira abdelmalekii]MBK1734256.1 triose-phosphate isomerase [Halorhodospira abdelmalekii]
MRRKIIAGNWKMNGDADLVRRIAEHAADAISGAELVVCPPYTLLPTAASHLPTGVGLGAQDVSEYPAGAYTGEVSAAMLLEAGCRYVIVGHSERRTLYGEDNARVAAKYAAARGAGLTPILCVGETLAERDAQRTESVVGEQIDAVLEAVGATAFSDAVIAYEPVWAIGTGRTAAPEQAQQVHAFIRARVAERDPEGAAVLPILYGGSVKPENAAELFAQEDIDGGLIGGASLDSEGFLAIHRAAVGG